MSNFLQNSFLGGLDWLIVILVLVVSLVIGLVFSKQAKKSSSDFFLAGRSMPWWLLGVSMVATTFSTDTPNLVTDLVRQQGIAGNWAWWAFLLSGMLTVFIFAKLWRRANILTDIEFYEIRYSGKSASFLRGFRAVYLGLLFNVVVMGGVTLAAVKFGEIVLGLPGWVTVLIAGGVTLAYSSLGGLKSVILTDFIQFIMAIVGSFAACFYILSLDEVGGLTNLLQNANVKDKLDIIPATDSKQWISFFIIPLAVQWWASYYPGAEPGGGGYIAQRMFSAKDEKNSVGATFLFNLAHYAIRPWPWILIALASLVLFPNLEDIKNTFPNLSEGKLGHDVAYPAMLTKLPVGLLGVVAASLVAAFMSTMSTQVNLGASYLVNDVYKRFIKTDASEKEMVTVGKLISFVSMVLGCGLGLVLTSAGQAFQLLLLLGAGTGLIYILRWFWWRITASTEIIAMIVSLIVAVFFTFIYPKITSDDARMDSSSILLVGVCITTVIWLFSIYIPKLKNKTLILIGVMLSFFITMYIYSVSLSASGVTKDSEFYTMSLLGLFVLSLMSGIFISAFITMLLWIISNFLSEKTDKKKLISFYQKIKPFSLGWQKVIAEAKADKVDLSKEGESGQNFLTGIFASILGCVVVYGILLGSGWLIMGNTVSGLIAIVVAGLSGLIIYRLVNKIKFS